MAGGVNDITIISGITFFFIACAVLVPIIQDSFSASSTTANDVSGFAVNLRSELPQKNEDKSIFGLIFPVWFFDGLYHVFNFIVMFLGMALWSFGVLPLFLELLLFMPLRIIFWVTIIRNVWIGGGG